MKPRSFAPCNSHGSSRRKGHRESAPPWRWKGSAHQRKRSEVRSTPSPKACHKSQPLEERNKSSAPDLAVALDDLAECVACGQRFWLAIWTEWPTMTRQASVSVSWVECLQGAGGQPSVVLLLKVQLEGHAFRAASLQAVHELCAGGGRYLDGHLRDLVASRCPTLDLAAVRFSGDVARFSAVHGLVVPPSPPKMPPGVDSGVGAGEPRCGIGDALRGHHHHIA